MLTAKTNCVTLSVYKITQNLVGVFVLQIKLQALGGHFRAQIKDLRIFFKRKYRRKYSIDLFNKFKISLSQRSFYFKTFFLDLIFQRFHRKEENVQGNVILFK